jgi:hypothetical protein
MLVLSRDFGVTWDEKTHQLYGERAFRFLTDGSSSFVTRAVPRAPGTPARWGSGVEGP